jgi:RNA polymerase sigma-70 factor (ECF subfamily)
LLESELVTAGRAFMQELAARRGLDLPNDPPLEERLDAAIRAVHQQGAEAWKPVALELETFARHLAGAAAAAGEDPAAALAGLHGTDLYLACAAGNGSPGAVERLALHFLNPIAGSLQAIDSAAAVIDEVRQCLHERLLVPDEGPPRILQYGGRSALATWVGVAAQRMAFTLLRAESARRRTTERAGEELLPVDLDPELQYLKERYRDDFKAALAAAIGRLGQRERTVVRLYTLGGLTLARIGTMFGVDESTVSRWVQRARETILAETQRELGVRLGIRVAEVPSLVRLVSSQLDVSLARLLEEEKTG